MKYIDLHGMIEAEANAAVIMALYSLDDNEELEIITGNGEVLKDVAIEIILSEGYKYEQNGFNTGSIIVWK